MFDPADPRLAPFQDIGPARRLEPPRVFVAEGENIVLRLLASDWPCETILCAERKVDRLRPHLRPEIELIVATDAEMASILGFKFHSGVLATGTRRPFPTAADWLATRAANNGKQRHGVLLVLPEITDPLNFGAILRNAAAFGVAGVLIGERCRDPLSRQTIRTSMGTLFRLPLARSENLVVDLARLRAADYECWATVLDADATPLPAAGRPGRVALLMGNEGPGLEADVIAACDRRVTIGMSGGTDSLNVAAASAVFLYHLTRGAR